MPDWSYHVALKNALFAVPRNGGRRFVTRFLGFLTKLPLGAMVVDLLGHMHPPKILRKTLGGVDLDSPVGLTAVVDPDLHAAQAFERFGFGFLCAGPVACREEKSGEGPRRLKGRAGILDPGFHKFASSTLLARLKKRKPRLPIVVKIAWSDGAAPEAALREIEIVLAELSPYAAYFLLDARLFAGYARWTEPRRKALLERVAVSERPVLLEIPFNAVSERSAFLREAVVSGVKGFVVGPRSEPEGMIDAPGDRDAVLAQVERLRGMLGEGGIVFAGSSIVSPRDAVDALAAGADGVLLGSGFVFTGPGLPKRINEALESLALMKKPPQAADGPEEPWKTSWFWGVILGGSMLLGSAMALIFALTVVILPYDETMSGITRPMLEAFNPRIVSFMIHDRATLAGTMTSLGGLYLALAWYGIRKGHAWAHHILVISALIGFLSFLSFLGSGYFDPFHGFVTAVLLQFLLLVIVLHRPEPKESSPLHLDNDPAWKRALWGQTAFVAQGFALIVAGMTIGLIGMTSTLVHEDVEYLRMTVEQIRAFHPSLIPLIAHDRETFGNMLVCAGIVILFSALWGFRYGRKWLWWIWLIAGYPPYLQTLWIHLEIGYENLFHLSPVFLGLGVQTAGLALCHRFLSGNQEKTKSTAIAS